MKRSAVPRGRYRHCVDSKPCNPENGFVLRLLLECKGFAITVSFEKLLKKSLVFLDYLASFGNLRNCVVEDENPRFRRKMGLLL